MGRDHAVSGALLGLGAIELARATGTLTLSLPATAVATAVVAGSALLPDIDHPSSTVARTFGPATELLAHGTDRVSAWVHKLTATPHDQAMKDGHRTLTHTVAFALSTGGLIAALGAAFGRWAVLAALFACLTLALRGLAPRGYLRRGGWLGVTATAAALTAASSWAAPEIGALPLGALVAYGCWAHCLGDSCTLHGCPWLWPIPIRRQRWYRIGTPHWLRFRTGTDEFDGEDLLRALMYAALAGLLLNLVPGFWAWAAERVGDLTG
jgi:membrane-bound metal-dependent hydrolase YbcI (DUF457 family)